VLANILRTDPHSHRPLPVDSELAQSIQVLARAHQDAVWDRMQIANKLRSVLREYYPAFLAAFGDLASREARATLHLAPSPMHGQQLRKPSLTAALHRAGRTRGIPAAVNTIHAALHVEQRRQPTLVESAMAEHATALLHALDTAVANVARLEQTLTVAFDQHPDAQTRQHYDESRAFPNRPTHPVTSNKPSAHDAHQQTQAQPEINRGVKRPVTSITPPANKARLKTEAQPA
jgi:hypothetical protein